MPKFDFKLKIEKEDFFEIVEKGRLSSERMAFLKIIEGKGKFKNKNYLNN